MAATPLMNEFHEVAHLTPEDLEDLLNDPAYFQSIFHPLPQVKKLHQAQAELGMANKAIARASLSLQVFGVMWSANSETIKHVVDSRMRHMNQYLMLLQQFECSTFNPQFLLLRIRRATTPQDDTPEVLASSFVPSSPTPSTGNDASDVDEFVREFRELRKVYHKRLM
ncbi:hypothetical protein DFH29DRAFT_994226 [Suillus ampliporus]|nr:hypothetical protein DFH29DRAFT_994226 [Suillus ampliporus]